MEPREATPEKKLKEGGIRKTTKKLAEPLYEDDLISKDKVKRNEIFTKEDGYVIAYTERSYQGQGKDQKEAKAGLGVYWGQGNHLNKGCMVEGKAQTNNIGEMRAVILAIKIAYRKRIKKLEIRSDSKYRILMATKAMEYKSRGWKTKSKAPILNKKDVMNLYNTINTKTTFYKGQYLRRVAEWW